MFPREEIDYIIAILLKKEPLRVVRFVRAVTAVANWLAGILYPEAPAGAKAPRLRKVAKPPRMTVKNLVAHLEALKAFDPTNANEGVKLPKIPSWLLIAIIDLIKGLLLK